VPAGIEVATVNVPEIAPFPLGPGTVTVHAVVPEAKRPVGADGGKEHVVAFELKPFPETVTTVPKLPLVGVTLIAGTSVNLAVK